MQRIIEKQMSSGRKMSLRNYRTCEERDSEIITCNEKEQDNLYIYRLKNERILVVTWKSELK